MSPTCAEAIWKWGELIHVGKQEFLKMDGWSKKWIEICKMWKVNPSKF